MAAALATMARRQVLVSDTSYGVVLTSAAAGLACPAYFAAEPLGWLIPIGRFTGLAVAATAGPRLACASCG